MTTSKKFQIFLASFIEKMSVQAHREGLNIESLRQLDAAEKTQAEALLLEKLESKGGDDRVIIGLGELKSQKALPLLREYLPSSAEIEEVEDWSVGKTAHILKVCKTLWQIERAQEALLWVLQILEESPHRNARMDVAVELRAYPCQESADALWRTLEDDDKLTRMHAMTSLLMIHGLWEDKFSSPPLALQVGSNDPAARQKAIAEAREAIKNSSIKDCA